MGKTTFIGSVFYLVSASLLLLLMVDRVEFDNNEQVAFHCERSSKCLASASLMNSVVCSCRYHIEEE